VFVGDRCQ